MTSNEKPVAAKPEKVIIPPSSNEKFAYELFNATPTTEDRLSLQEAYAASKVGTEVDQYEFQIDDDNARVLYMSELLIGDQGSDVDFYLGTLDTIKNLPEEMKPHLMVISGLLQGDFKFLEKTRRANLAQGFGSMDAQFHYGRQMIEAAQEIGVPIIYNMSNDDLRIAEDYTYEVLRQSLKDQQTHAKFLDPEGFKSSGASMSVSAVDRLRQHPKFNEHLTFQVGTVFPYCLRNGRRLYTAEEMGAHTAGKIDFEEYYVLYDMERRAKEGLALTPAQRQWKKVVEKEQVKDLVIADNLDLEIKTNEQTYNDMIRHVFALSDKTLSGSYMKTPITTVKQMASNGEQIPDMLVVQNNLEGAGVSDQNKWVVSTPGMIDGRQFLETRGVNTAPAGGPGKRSVTTRRRIAVAGATQHERTADGRHIVTIFNDKLTEKSESIPERMTIAELCDFQTGSITARPDLLAKYLDYIRVHALGNRSTAIYFGGDMLHGRNYPHFPSESQLTGLMAVESQKAFNLRLFNAAMGDMDGNELAAIDRVLVQPGNHEWNSGLSWHGDPFVDYMRGFFRETFRGGGYSHNEVNDLVKTHEATVTSKGEYATGYTGIEYFGEMGVLIQHYLLERGGKGSGGDMPVYQGHDFATGGGDLMSAIDVNMTGHWHHPQYAVLGNKANIVGGSIAGVSDYELKRGYRPTIAGTMLHIGEGLPLQIEFVSEQALHAHKIQKGQYTDENLSAEWGLRDDRGFDPIRHGIFTPEAAKSALQKKVIRDMQDSSYRLGAISELR